MKISRLLALLPLLATSAAPVVAQQVAPAPTSKPPRIKFTPSIIHDSRSQRSVMQVKAPFRYIWGKAHHILPETHTDESGYFSIAEGRNGKIYVGTAKYNFNSFLVEFDPQTEQQKIVIDTHQLVGSTATGYAAQSKIHTRGFVAPSGVIYEGSQEGYRPQGDTQVYPGGYVMSYDPRTGRTQNLGMPMVGKGVIDVVADEARGLLYVVTSVGEDRRAHWLLGDLRTKTYRNLGTLLAPYATTLMDKWGRAHALTEDLSLATFDPQTGAITRNPIEVNRARLKNSSTPAWQLAPGGKSAYLIFLNDPTLLRVDFSRKSNNKTIKPRVLGKMLKGKNFDSRSSITVAPDGRVYTLYRVDNETGFGGGYLHHISRYDPRRNKIEDLGVLAVKNPDFFDFSPRADGTRPPWSHGYHTLPDGTMTPLHGHQGLIAARDGSLYALILYPYTLLHIPAQNIGVKPINERSMARR